MWGEVILKPAIFRGYRTHSALVGLLIGCQSVTCQAQASQAPARNSEAADVELADIVVTAQKRAERLRDVPISIGVMRSEERRVGKGCVSTWRTRWSTYPTKKQKREEQP